MKKNQRDEGSCLRCGRCCMWISMVINQEIGPDTAVYLDTHGCRRRGNKLLIPSRCQHLKGDEPPYSCDLHGTVHKPTICDLYPGHKETSFTVFNECGFRKDMPPVPPDEPVFRKHRALRR
ncbi:MAG: YkgJ family cysteine cluster protein [Methanomicrobiales archaeon]|nr:YkgJ family cysteine cluster protein [Methanomicrobiales archaeon]